MNSAKLGLKLLAPAFLMCVVPQFGSADNKPSVDIDRAAMDNVVILQPEDPYPARAAKITTIEIGDAKAGECSYNELLSKAQSAALQSNANIIKITEMKARNKANIYDYLTATLYKADNPKLYEREIKWNKERKLTWNDFRGPVQHQMGDMVAAATYCGFGFETNQISNDNQKLKILVYNSFYTDKSWGHKTDQTSEVLEHEQCHFDICEVYTRRLRQRMNSISNVTVHNLQPTLNNIYEQIKKEYSDRQERYEDETEHGLIADAQKHWENEIAKELQETESWAKE
jgi:hypothetical protein